MRAWTLGVLWLVGCAGEPTPVSPVPTSPDPTEAEATARAWLAQRDAGIGDLAVRSVQTDALDLTHVRFGQVFEGVPVFGGSVIVHLRPDGTVRSVTDGLVHDVQLVNEALYAPEEAEEAAAQAAGGWGVLTADPVTELVVLRRDDVDRLTFRVDLERLDGSPDSSLPRVFVDAGSLEVVHVAERLHTLDGTATTANNGLITFPITHQTGPGIYTTESDRVDTYSCGYDDCSPNVYYVYSTTTDFSGWPEGADAHWGQVETDAYFTEVHGRDGLDDLGTSILGLVNYGSNYNNAGWTGSYMIYGDGDGATFDPLVSLDIVAHELGHGVTQFTAGLIYENEYGAMNESMSDVFGAAVEAWIRGPGPDVWAIGEQVYTPGTSGDALRYMDDPTLDGISTEHYTTRYTGTGDYGGVHINSGIGNLAYYLATDGGTHPNPVHRISTVEPLGFERSTAIWYRALTTYMLERTGFTGARNATIQAAEDLYGEGSFEVEQVIRAWAEVGVGSPWQESGDSEFTGLSGATNSWTYRSVVVPAGATALRVSTWGGTGDVDLYVRRNTQPSLTQFTCRSWNYGNDEQCVIASPQSGTWHVGLRGYQAYTGVNLEISVLGGCNVALSEVEGNGYDEDCDGLDADCGTVAGGSCAPELAVVELMPNPVNADEAGGQWVEVLNTGASAVELRGARLVTGGSDVTVDRHLVVRAGERALIATSADPELNGGLPIVGDDLPGFDLADGGDTLTLLASDGAVLDAVIYDATSSGAAVPNGASLSVDPAGEHADDNDIATWWCDGMSAFGDGDFGTPGAPNEPCGMSFDFAFSYDLDNGDDDGLLDDVTNTTTFELGFDDTRRWFTTANGGDNALVDPVRTTTSTGQTLSWTYEGTGVTYMATRGFGTDCFSGGTITNLPAAALAGAWDNLDCP